MTDFNAAPGPAPITAPPLTPPKISLLTAADVVDVSVGTEDRWITGHTFSPETCDPAGAGVICVAPGTVTKVPGEHPGIVAIDPFVIWAVDTCSGWSHRERDFYGRARRNLLAWESFWIEKEFMSNTLAQNSPYVLDVANTFTTATPSAVSALRALALVEQEASQHFPGRFMVHVRPVVMDLLVASQAVRREGNVWLTPLDNIVVPGRGYSGIGPAGQAVTASSEWIYATSAVQIRRGPVVFTPEQVATTVDNPNGLPASAVTRTTNDITIGAERFVSVSFDPSCGVIAGQVNPTL